MPGKVRVKIVAGRNLPVMDRSSDTTDAFAEVKLGDTTYKTDVYRKSLNPAWNSDWFKFEVDDLELQDEPLQIRIMDYDTYSANDAIGKVYIDLNPLLLSHPGHAPETRPETGAGNIMSGWLPVFDTMHGIRGEVHIIVKVELFSDLNKFRQSSCGVQFFCCEEVPEGYKAQFIPGFVEELLVNDDPEYKLIDKIRTSRASNEARQLLFNKLSGELRRKIGLKALELGGNAVIGYKQNFDLEGSDLVVRGIGTAVTLSRLQPGDVVTANMVPSSPSRCSRENSTGPEMCDPLPDSPQPQVSSTPERSDSIGVTQRQDSEQETPPRGGASVGSSSSEKYSGRNQRTIDKDMPEFPFLTITKFPPGFLLHLGGMVSSKSVKLLEELDDRDEGDTREAWWVEIRQEVRSHAKALGCNMIVGYQEKTVIWEDVLVLSAAGTAAVCNLGFMAELDSSASCVLPGRLPVTESKVVQNECSVSHIPYQETSVPFPIRLSRCGGCGRGKVPDILLTTVEPPPGLDIMGQGGLIQARVLKLKRDLKGENNAREVSDVLPFIEYEIHRQLVNKLKVKGMNAIFGLNVVLSMNDRMIVVLATGTSVYLSTLPNPDIPKVSDTTAMEGNKGHIAKLQTKIQEKVEKNKEYFGLGATNNGKETLELESETEKTKELELCAGNKDTCVLEVDDIDDADIVDSLMDAHPPPGFTVISVNTPVGEDPGHQVTLCQTFSQLWRGKITGNPRDFSTAVQQLVTAVCFKLRRLQPCLISSLNWTVELDEENEIQINMSGVAIGFVDRDKKDEVKKKDSSSEREMMFSMEDTDNPEKTVSKLKQSRQPPYFFASNIKPFGINITPCSFIPGARIDHHLGSLNFFFIRESSNVREMGGPSCFVQQFLNEVFGILRSHVSSLGGNAVTSYFMSYCVLSYVPHKNQAQCLVNIGGDVVSAAYVTKS